jgi:hypothetical protein
MGRIILALVLAASLAGCDDTSSDTAGASPAAQQPSASVKPASSISGTAPQSGVSAQAASPEPGRPLISGAPRLSVVAGNSYSFTPTFSASGDGAPTFSIQNKPPWANFDAATGTLSGTPTAANIGTTSGIVISVSDGDVDATLPAFSIAVTQIGAGSATLSWTPPTQNTDGSALTNLAGYNIYYGTSASSLTQIVQVNSAGIATYVIDNLAAATWYFAIKAYTTTNVESSLSGIVSKTIQ